MIFKSKYFILLLVNLITLFLIGFFPVYLSLTSGDELEQLLPMALTVVCWIPATFIAIFAYLAIVKLIKLERVNIIVVVIICFAINIIASLIIPLSYLFVITKIEYTNSAFKVDFSMDSEYVVGDVYHYTLDINNKTSKTFTIYELNVMPIVIAPKRYSGFISISQIGNEKVRELKIPPGNSQIQGNLRFDCERLEDEEIPPEPNYYIKIIYRNYDQSEKNINTNLNWSEICL